jgi:hypothetical protein
VPPLLAVALRVVAGTGSHRRFEAIAAHPSPAEMAGDRPAAD